MCKYCEGRKLIDVNEEIKLQLSYNRMAVLKKVENFNFFGVFMETKIRYCPYCGRELPELNVRLGERMELW